MIFPWQTTQQQHLWQAKMEQRLPHALLLSGIEGTGKTIFAAAFAQALLCQAPTAIGEACGECQDCRLVKGKAHPSILTVTPEEDSRVIKIDQVREVSEFVNQTALRGQWRIVMIHPAECMNANAANALLKTLEEPSGHVLLMLISHQGERMPATILSRCQRIVFARPPQQQALAWLAAALKTAPLEPALLLTITNGAPLAALRFVEEEKHLVRQALFDALCLLGRQQGDPVKLAAKLPEADLLLVLDLMLSWVADWVRVPLKGSIVNQDYAEALQTMKPHCGTNTRAHLLNELLHLRGRICQGINLNKQLVVESALVNWMNAA